MFTPIIGVADDLTGAAETAAALAGLSPNPAARHRRVAVYLGLPNPVELADVTVFDLATRHLDSREAARRLRAALAALPDGPVVYKKIDSQLRGNTAVELRALAAQRRLVIAPALPALGRATIDGRLAFRGRSPAGNAAQPAVAELLPDHRAGFAGLAEVRSPRPVLARFLAEALRAAHVVICDSETDDDLQAVAAAAVELPGAMLAGSAGLAGALSIALGLRQPEAGPTPADFPVRASASKILVVAGSAEPAVTRQVQALRLKGGVPVYTLHPRTGHVTVAGGQDAQTIAVAIGQGGPPDPSRGPAIHARLASFVRNRIDDQDLVLLGGETARLVLDLIGQKQLTPKLQIAQGAVVSLTSAGRIVATRPGSYGDVHSILEMVRSVQALRTRLSDSPVPAQRRTWL